MKRLFTILSFCFLLSNVNAQIADGTYIENFSFVDLDGNVHELYDILNEGRSVVVDVFATWCGPCWTYHNNGALKDLWEAYGPDGTNEMYVIAVEGDGSTPLDAIYGTAGSTIGDWTVGVDYPITDNASIANQLQINYFPTIFMICQDRTIREVGQISTGELYDFHNTCAQPVGEKNGSLTDYKGYTKAVCADFPFSPKITLNNRGNEIMTAATISLNINGETVETYDFAGEMYPFDRTEIELPEIIINPADEITINIESVNGETDEDASDNIYSTTVAIPAEVPTQTINVEILTDDKGHEIYWRVANPDGTIFEYGGNIFVNINGGGDQDITFGGYDDNTLITETVTFPADDCFKFTIVDDWGDGLTGDGYYKVTDADGNVLTEGSDFGIRTEKDLSVQYFVNTNEIKGLESLEIFPNPTADDLNINLGLTESIDATLYLTDLTGKMIQTQKLGQLSAGEHQLNLSLGNLPNGIYYVELVSETGIFTQKVVKM